jgi:hypothetical protein
MLNEEICGTDGHPGRHGTSNEEIRMARCPIQDMRELERIKTGQDMKKILLLQ